MALITRLASRLAILLLALSPLLAAADPPARVGRLSLLEGGVLLRVDRQDAGTPAAANWPISSGAILDTDPNAHAEVRIGSTALRLDGGSRVEFAIVDDERVSLNLGQGSLSITARDPDQTAGIEIATPSGQVRLDGPGRYRIDVNGKDGSIEVSCREGDATVFRAGSQLSLSPGQRAVAYGNGGWYVAELRANAFDAWSDARDKLTSAPAARRYVSPQMTGYEDLDRYGYWSNSSEYGSIWYPSGVTSDWAPYRYGRWAWVEPWGWTWVDDAPWGFAPFHYGRWVVIGRNWAWVPGSYHHRPVYAPALVGWMGEPDWRVGFQSGRSPAVGWFPLAPHEVYVPAYHSSRGYIRQVNASHVTNNSLIDRFAAGGQRPAYMHHDQPRAVTVVPAATLQNGSPIGNVLWRHADQRTLASAPVAPTAPNLRWLAPSAVTLHPHYDTASANPGPAPTHTAAPAPANVAPPVPRNEIPSQFTRQAPSAPAPATSLQTQGQAAPTAATPRHEAITIHRFTPSAASAPAPVLTVGPAGVGALPYQFGSASAPANATQTSAPATAAIHGTPRPSAPMPEVTRHWSINTEARPTPAPAAPQTSAPSVAMHDTPRPSMPTPEPSRHWSINTESRPTPAPAAPRHDALAPSRLNVELRPAPRVEVQRAEPPRPEPPKSAPVPAKTEPVHPPQGSHVLHNIKLGNGK